VDDQFLSRLTHWHKRIIIFFNLGKQIASVLIFCEDCAINLAFYLVATYNPRALLFKYAGGDDT
jgi:hypothetical protein